MIETYPHNIDTNRESIDDKLAGAPPLLPMPVSGRSMWPTLHPGDTLWVRLTPDHLKPGDIVVFRRGGELFAHRFLALRVNGEKQFYLAKGDGHWSYDPLWPEQSIFGVVESVERNDVIYPMNNLSTWRRWLSVGVNMMRATIYQWRAKFLIILLIFAVLTPVAEAAVSLISFTATLQGESVLLRWETASEVNALGFNLYRSPLTSGEERQINSDIIPATGDIAGSVYQYIDQPPLALEYQYRLEEIDANGQVESFAPVVITMITVTPSPSPTAINTVTPSPTPTATVIFVPTNTTTPSATPTITGTNNPSVTPTKTSTATSTLIPTASPVASPSSTPTRFPMPTTSNTPLPGPTLTPSPNRTPIAPTVTAIPSSTPTPVQPTLQPTEVPVISESPAPSVAPTIIPTSTSTAATINSAILPISTPDALQFPDTPASSSPDTAQTPASTFALIGALGLVGAGLLAGVLIIFRRRWFPQ